MLSLLFIRITIAQLKLFITLSDKITFKSARLCKWTALENHMGMISNKNGWMDFHFGTFYDCLGFRISNLIYCPHWTMDTRVIFGKLGLSSHPWPQILKLQFDNSKVHTKGNAQRIIRLITIIPNGPVSKTYQRTLEFQRVPKNNLSLH